MARKRAASGLCAAASARERPDRGADSALSSCCRSQARLRSTQQAWRESMALSGGCSGDGGGDRAGQGESPKIGPSGENAQGSQCTRRRTACTVEDRAIVRVYGTVQLGLALWAQRVSRGRYHFE